MALTPQQRQARARLASHTRWAREQDRTAATAAARAARDQKYITEAREIAGPDAAPEEIAQRAESLRRADLNRMALRSARRRRKDETADDATGGAA